MNMYEHDSLQRFFRPTVGLPLAMPVVPSPRQAQALAGGGCKTSLRSQLCQRALGQPGF